MWFVLVFPPLVSTTTPQSVCPYAFLNPCTHINVQVCLLNIHTDLNIFLLSLPPPAISVLPCPCNMLYCHLFLPATVGGGNAICFPIMAQSCCILLLVLFTIFWFFLICYWLLFFGLLLIFSSLLAWLLSWLLFILLTFISFLFSFVCCPPSSASPPLPPPLSLSSLCLSLSARHSRFHSPI